MSITKEQILECLRSVIEPNLKKDIISLGLVSNVDINNNKISFDVSIRNPAMHSRKKMEEQCIKSIQNLFGKDITVNVNIKTLPSSNEKNPELKAPMPGVKNIIAIASGKGGVGKSTITANLAVGLAQEGYQVGLIDADIFGPSIPIMFDVVNEKPKALTTESKQWMQPVENYGVKLLSIGFFAKQSQAVAWRGPMASSALKQMFSDTHWGELDYLLVDLPPGTSDIHLTLVQSIPLTGAIIVSTPQLVALADARKGVSMFQLPNVNVPVLGIIENMSYFTPKELPENKYYIFGKDGAKDLAQQLNIPLLGQIPLVQSIRESGDTGRPLILDNNTLQAKAFKQLTKIFIHKLETTQNTLAVSV